MKILRASEDYLEAMLMMKEKHGYIRSIDVAEQLGVTKPSVTYTTKRLRENGYITMDKDGFITLSESGMQIASSMLERHRMLSSFLMALGVDEETALQDACRMEHVVSDETVQQICNFVNYGSTFEHALRNTDLRYRYEPGEYSFLMGIYYMEKTCPRRLAGEFKNYKEQIRLHVKKEDSYFELFCTAPEEKNCSLVCGPRNRLGKSRRRKRKSPDPNRRF